MELIPRVYAGLIPAGIHLSVNQSVSQFASSEQPWGLSLWYKSPILKHISLLGYCKKLLKFGSFTYSRWPPNIWVMYEMAFLQRTACSFYCRDFLRYMPGLHVYLLGPTQEILKIWRICIFKLCFKQHIFLSAVHSFYCMGVQFSYVTLLEPLPENYYHLAHLHIQYGHQNSKYMVRAAHHSVYNAQIKLQRVY